MQQVYYYAICKYKINVFTPETINKSLYTDYIQSLCLHFKLPPKK